jgi:hypothetical protein
MYVVQQSKPYNLTLKVNVSTSQTVLTARSKITSVHQVRRAIKWSRVLSAEYASKVRMGLRNYTEQYV